MDIIPELQIIVLSFIDSNTMLAIVRNTTIIENLSFHIKNIEFDFSSTNIDDDDLIKLKGSHAINLSDCNQITDKGLENLKGVHIIDLSNCDKITDRGLEKLKGVHTIYLWNCNKITDIGLEYIKGAKINIPSFIY